MARSAVRAPRGAAHPPLLLAFAVWGLGAALYLIGFFQRVAPAVLTRELSAEFALTAAALGNLSAVYFYSYVAMQIPTGLLADHWGARRTLALGGMVAAAGALLFGLAESYALVAFGRFLIGGAVGVAFVCMLKLSTHWFEHARFATITGLAVATGVVGAVSAGAPLRWAADAFGWRPVMIASGVLTAAVAVAVVLPLAFVTTRYRSRVGGVANTFVVSGFAIPGLVVALALVFWVLNTPVLSSLYQTLPVLIFAYVVHFGAQSMRAAQVAVGGVARGVGDAATMLGAGPVRRFRTIDLPLMTPGLLAGAGLVLLSTMKELPATLLLRPTRIETLSTRIWNAAEDGFLTEMAIAALILVALSGLLTWLLVVRPQPFR